MKSERERYGDYHLDIGTIEQTNGGLNHIIPTKLKIGRNAYLEPLRIKLLLVCTPQRKQLLYTLRFTVLIRPLRGHTPLDVSNDKMGNGSSYLQ